MLMDTSAKTREQSGRCSQVHASKQRGQWPKRSILLLANSRWDRCRVSVPAMDHTSATTTTTKRRITASFFARKELNARHTQALSRIGNTQYPSRQTLWKNDSFPPRSCPLIVTTDAPTHMMTKMTEKTREASSCAFRLSITAKDMQIKSGPQRSQSRSSALTRL